MLLFVCCDLHLCTSAVEKPTLKQSAAFLVFISEMKLLQCLCERCPVVTVYSSEGLACWVLKANVCDDAQQKPGFTQTP